MRRLPLRSPPRVRGKELRVETCFSHDGITPAYAGKRVSRSRAKTGEWDHPRVCGEKTVIHKNDRIAQGSPPRVRGKVADCGNYTALIGITPAYAGKSCQRLPERSGLQDHPRVCGEKDFEEIQDWREEGSPPRMRGKVCHTDRISSYSRITPAYAGKSARRQAGPPGPAPPPQMRLGWSPPPCTGRQCRTRKSTHARRARIPVPAHTPAPQ